MSAMYAASLVLPDSAGALPDAHDTLDAALLAAGQLPGELGTQVAQLARAAFERAFIAVLASAAAILLMAALVLRQLHRRAQRAGTALPI